jgi:hypothetical protein
MNEWALSLSRDTGRKPDGSFSSMPINFGSRLFLIFRWTPPKDRFPQKARADQLTICIEAGPWN